MTTFKYPNPNIYYMTTNDNKLIINFPAAKMILKSPNFVISAEADIALVYNCIRKRIK